MNYSVVEADASLHSLDLPRRNLPDQMMDFGARFLAQDLPPKTPTVFIGTYITYTAPYLGGGLKV